MKLVSSEKFATRDEDILVMGARLEGRLGEIHRPKSRNPGMLREKYLSSTLDDEDGVKLNSIVSIESCTDQHMVKNYDFRMQAT